DTSQKSFFALFEYHIPNSSPNTNHKIHFGVRGDNHSEYESETSIRAGYVGTWPKTALKLFYGEAFQEPSARLLYGGWQGSGSDPNLNPRNAETYDFNINYQLEKILLSLNLFRMNSDNLFNTTDDGAVNAGLGKSYGGDLRFRFQSELSSMKSLTLWLNYSWLSAEEQSFNQNQQLVWKDSGDLADYTVHFGAYLTFSDQWQLNMRGRHYGDRKTIESNPLNEVESFTTFDLNLSYQPQADDYRISMEVTNLLDEDYFHPGVRSASASSTNSGMVNANGVWIGSESFYNAQIPQPGREIRMSFYWRF
ncbi:MAG: TonB-dependent receptor, partial [Kangiellaceae bacterium]|nr:TonB-dependent receptor [Kangiellaceae bacterium]